MPWSEPLILNPVMETTGCVPGRFPAHGMASPTPATTARDLLPFIAPRTPWGHEHQNEVHWLVTSQRSKHELSQEPKAKRSWNQERSLYQKKAKERAESAVGFSSPTQDTTYSFDIPLISPLMSIFRWQALGASSRAQRFQPSSRSKHC